MRVLVSKLNYPSISTVPGFICMSSLWKLYSPLWGCAGDRVEMVVEVHCGAVLGDKFSTMLKMCSSKQSHNALWQPLSWPGLPCNLKVANTLAIYFTALLKYTNNCSVLSTVLEAGLGMVFVHANFGGSYYFCNIKFLQLMQTCVAKVKWDMVCSLIHSCIFHTCLFIRKLLS